MMDTDKNSEDVLAINRLVQVTPASGGARSSDQIDTLLFDHRKMLEKSPNMGHGVSNVQGEKYLNTSGVPALVEQWYGGFTVLSHRPYRLCTDEILTHITAPTKSSNLQLSFPALCSPMTFPRRLFRKPYSSMAQCGSFLRRIPDICSVFRWRWSHGRSSNLSRSYSKVSGGDKM
jgi:hypothetical protein